LAIFLIELYSKHPLSRIKKILLLFVIACFLLSVWFVQRVIYNYPKNLQSSVNESNLVTLSPTHFTLNNSWLKLSKNGNWECYIEGNGYERGKTLGILQRQLGKQQEEVFIKEIDSKVPSWFLKKLLIVGIAWFNRDLDAYIPQEYREEIYGISEFFSNDFNTIGPKYNRIINYHAAHDIGHAVQNMHLVGCTAFGTWQFDSTKQHMIMGRNFDFYFGDEFAKNKVVLLSNPTSGYKSVSVTWPSFIGVVSGINEKGLGITLNSDKSEIPTKSGTPVSIIARDILQYASTIEEAIEICNKYQSFVSESFTVSSAIDKTVVVIEKTPTSTGIYTPSADTIIVTNHFQSKNLKELPLNVEHKKTSESVRRYNRTAELLANMDTLDYNNTAIILRDIKGLNGKDIGLGNPLAINQLLAHHAVIFDNVKKLIWVSSYPYQLNNMAAYSLSNFDNWKADEVKFPITIDSLEIAPDPFFYSSEFNDFEEFKEISSKILKATNEGIEINESFISKFVSVNPNYYQTHLLLGNYYNAIGKAQKAIEYYKNALNKDIAYQEDKSYIEAQINKIKSDD